jgi:hypothetical protein
MYRSVYSVQADDCAARALEASCDVDREILLATEKFLRQFAQADERIQQVRSRNPALFAGRPLPRPANSDDKEKAA